MKWLKSVSNGKSGWCDPLWIMRLFVIGLAAWLMTGNARGQLFNNLQALGSRLRVGDPNVPALHSLEGPKGVATADFDADGHADLAICNTDGTITLYFGKGDGKFSGPLHLQTGSQEMRGIVCGDLNGDGKPDIAVAGPYSAQVFMILNRGGRDFDPPVILDTWLGARNLAIGDFDGDGIPDMVIAGTTNGLRQLRNTGPASFDLVTNIVSLSATNNEFPRPVYTMKAFRTPGSSSDWLAAAQADGDDVWILAPSNGVLQVQGSIYSPRVHAIDVGPVTRSSSNAVPDLVTASRDRGYIEVRRGNDSPNGFETLVTQRMQVPGGPRALEIVDLDGDGWNDLVVVLRNFDRVLTYHNSNGVLVASTEMPVGKSPRELVSGDFNGDGLPDVAVMNRDSADVSVLITYPGQAAFGALDQIYPVDGEVSGLIVLDMNGDGRDDVIQLHRASAEISVRLAGTNGLLGAPTYYPMGSVPTAQAAVDVNNDGYPDMVTANLGVIGVEYGSVSVRLGDGQGGFLPEQRFFLPVDVRGSLFALVAADFDNDGYIDLAAGFYDCRVAFFKGDGQGGFTFTKAHRFVYEARVMVVGDFDKDGDIDLAGAGYAGDVVVIENKGDLLTTDTLTRTDYPSPTANKFGTRDIVAVDVNRDGDLDLIVGSGQGAMLFLGRDGMAFERISDSLPGTDFPAAAVATGDFDGDGVGDIAISCRILSCISILTKGTNSEYQPALTVDVPAGEFLASGDLDGDGKADLVGSGSVLWTALSSHRAQPSVPLAQVARRDILEKPVINEILAMNTDLPVELDGDRNSDWVELFNGSLQGLPMNGWKLRLTTSSTTGVTSNNFSFPPTAFFSSKGYLLVIFSETRRTVYHTGFKLPASGGTLSLINPSGQIIDTVEFPAQQENISYARYRDGAHAFVFNPYPSPARSNSDNGPVEPEVKLQDAQIASLTPNEPVRFTVTGRDAVGLVSVSVFWKRLDMQDSAVHRVDLYDDGDHGDEGMRDGIFSGLLQPGLPAGTDIQFYLEATDLSGQTVYLPNEPVFAAPGAILGLYSLSLGGERPACEISELVAANVSGLRDEAGNLTDWIEIRNCSTTPVPLKGLALARSFYATDNRHVFADADLLMPGEHRVIFCDGQPSRGALHAPFTLSRSGDNVVLTGQTTNGGRFFIDSVSFASLGTNVAWARLGCGGAWRQTMPTPRSGNMVETWLGSVSPDGTLFTLAFPTVTNRTYTVEYADAITGQPWRTLSRFAGTGIEHLLYEETIGRRFYRVRTE